INKDLEPRSGSKGKSGALEVSMAQPNVIPLMSHLSEDHLIEMQQAAAMVSETMRVLQKSGSNVVAEVLRTAPEFIEWEHMPPEDAYDHESHSQFYYHAHAKSEDGTGHHDDEHGHFHLFLRGPGMPQAYTPAPLPDVNVPTNRHDINTHLIGIGMNEMGVPTKLFTVNRWVTAETWFSADDIIALLPSFEMDTTVPSWPLNLWLTNMVTLFRPHIEQLIRQRDASIAKWQEKHPAENSYEDRRLEVTSSIDIDLAAYVEQIIGE
ncbi:MAG: hypothetical protein AAF986_08370, partial [Pseudomonadota bacterium]